MSINKAKRKWSKKKLSLLALLVFISAITAMAAVFVYYPLKVNVQQQSPPVQFATGSNSGKADLDGQSIGVNIGTNKTSVTLSLHPTYQITYYKNILNITNNGTNTYQVYIRVTTPMTLPSGGYAIMYIINGTTSYTVNLTTTGTTTIGPITPGSSWEVDIKIYIPSGQPLISTSGSLNLIYTPESGESPP